MKKLILVLTVAFMLMAGTVFAATLKMVMYASENDGTSGTMAGMAGPPITADYYFTIETDESGNITAFTDFMSNYFYAASVGYVSGGTISYPVGPGGYDPRDGDVFQPGEQIYPNGIKQYASTAFDGNTAGTGLWWRSQSNPDGIFGGLVFNCGLLDITYNADTDMGLGYYGPDLTLTEYYKFHLAPILAAHAGPDFTITRGDQISTVIEGTAFDPDDLPLTYRWLEGMDELSLWEDVGENGESYLNLSSVPPLSIGDHTLILEISDGENVVSNQMILSINNSIPVADAGSDQAIFDAVILDGGASFDPDGVIESYQWTLRHREESLYDQTSGGQNPTIEGLEPGFYDVTLAVTDNDGVTDTDTMLLAAAGPCKAWPQPNADLNIKRFNITNIKRNNRTFTSLLGSIDLPDIDLQTGDSVETRITIELFNALEGGGDVVISDETSLRVKDRPRTLMITK